MTMRAPSGRGSGPRAADAFGISWVIPQWGMSTARGVSCWPPVAAGHNTANQISLLALVLARLPRTAARGHRRLQVSSDSAGPPASSWMSDRIASFTYRSDCRPTCTSGSMPAKPCST
jgi:hypothetical protein